MKKIIGDATLYLGDCLEILPDLGPVDCVIADPPYLINSKSSGGRGKLNPWADMCNNSVFWEAWLDLCRSRLAKGALWTFLNWRTFCSVQKAVCDLGESIASTLVWDKGGMGTGLRGLRPRYELVALLLFGGFGIANRRAQDITTVAWSGGRHVHHPAQKPVKLIERLLNWSTVAGDTALDPFMGSGTTGVAALGMGRKFIGIEQGKASFEIACQRLEQAQEALHA